MIRIALPSRARHAFLLLFADLAVEQPVAVQVDLQERRPGGDDALDKRLAERVLDVLLQDSAQRTGAVVAVHQRLVEDPLARVFVHRHRDRLLRQVGVELVHHQLDDRNQVLLGQRVEQDHLVETVEELGVEGALHLVLHHVLDSLRGHLLVRALEAQPPT
jgi:hypothetical protein